MEKYILYFADYEKNEMVKVSEAATQAELEAIIAGDTSDPAKVFSIEFQDEFGTKVIF